MQKKMYFLILDCNFLYKKSTKPITWCFYGKNVYGLLETCAIVFNFCMLLN